jgi:transposase
MHRRAWSEVLDHLGLVAGMFDELGIGDVLDRAMQHNPETRIVTVGNAVKAMVLNGLGFMNQQLDLVPKFFQNKPTPRLIAPGIDAQHLHDDTLGRALDMLYDYGVTELSSLIAATAAQRLGLAPTFAHLDSTSFHVDGHDNSAEEPDDKVIHITRGYSRDHRPDLNQVMLDLIVEHQAGIPLLMKPLSGNSSDVQNFGQIVTEHIKQLQTTSGTTSLVADSALSSAENLQKLGETGIKWITRVPATVTEAQDALAHADPETMEPLGADYRYHMLASTYGGVAQRWMLCSSAQRRPQAQRSVDKRWRKQSETEAKALQKLCRTAFACAADAEHALATFAHGLQAASLHEGAISARPRYGKRGRPSPDAPPVQVVYHITGALTSSLAAHAALAAPQSCFLLATNELDERRLSPQELLAGYKGQQQAERGFRFLKDPHFLAASLYLKKPERIMALLMVMTVCLLVYAALEYRIRKVLKDHDATFPNQKGQPVQNPTARWVFQYFVGIHLLRIRGEGAFVLNLNDQHQQLLRLLGRSYEAFYA